MKRATPTEQSAIMLDIFGVRGLRAGNAIMTNLETYKTLLHDITFESQGFMANIVAERMSNLSGSLNKMVSTLENIRIAFAESLGPVLIPVFKVLTWVFGKIKSLFEIPVLGTIISTTMALGVAILGVGSAIMFLRTKWLILRNDSQVSGASMFSLLMGGWDGARLKAERYMAVENAIIAQRKAGIMGNVPYTVMQTMPSGTVLNGVKQVTTKAGKQIYFQQTREGGWKRVSAAFGVGMMASANAKQTTETLMGGAAATEGAKKIAGSTGVLKSIGGVLGKGLSFLTGPWGMGIMAAITIGLPLLRSALGSLKSSVDSSKDSNLSLEETIQRDIQQRQADKDNPTNETLIKEMRALVQSIQYWSKGGNLNKKPQVININIDGKGVMKQVIEEYEKDININTNTK